MVRWVALESNPEVMNNYMSRFGVPDKWTVTDVYGLDEELLAMVPQPILSVVFLRPVKDQLDKENPIGTDGDAESVFFMKQTVGNACGSVALIHAVANNLDKIELEDGPLKEYIEKTKSMSPEDKGKCLESDEGITKAHEEVAQEGQTEAPDKDKNLDLHFVAFVEVDGNLYELDGRKENPVVHGATTPETLLSDAAKVCQEYMKLDAEENRFTVMALTASD